MSKSRRDKSRKRQQGRTYSSVSKLDRSTELKSPLSMRFVHGVLSTSRFIRIVLSGIFALTVSLSTGLVFYFIDIRFLLSYDGEVNSTLMIPVFVATALGLVMYMTGWWMIVGVRGEELAVRRGVLWYLGVGIASVTLSLAWLLQVVIVL